MTWRLSKEKGQKLECKEAAVTRDSISMTGISLRLMRR